MSAFGRSTKSKLIRSVKKHPVRTAGIAAGAVLGAVAIRKAVNTAAKVVTIKAVGGAAREVVTAVGKTGGRAGSRARVARTVKKSPKKK